MKFSYNFLQSFFKKKLPPAEELADKLMMHFFEVEKIEKTKDDIILDIDILPSRGSDSLSHIGIAREISAITGLEYEKPEVEIKEDKESVSDKVGVNVKDGCSRYMLRGVKGVKVKSSPAFIKQRLKSCGIKPINNIVDIANYVMMETGQPLHAFDGEKIEGEKIEVRFAKKREKIVTLDEKRYELESNILVITDELSPVGIAGIKGGIIPEVDKKTSFVLLEAANFEPKIIRKGSTSLNLRTDASLRFEYGLAPELAKEAIDRAVSLIAEIAGGKVLKGEIDYYPKKPEKKEISFKAQEIRKLLGIDVPLTEMERILRALHFKVSREKSSFHVEVPYFRLDISIKEDIAEEIGRIYGYENIEPLVPREKIVSKEESHSLKMEEICRSLFQRLGFNETYNYSFINNKDASIFQYEGLIEMEKPVSLEYKYLRPSLLPGLLKNAKENEKNFDKASIFELGKIFFRHSDEMKEKKMISGMIMPADFYDMKGRLEVFFKELSIENITYLSDERDNHFNYITKIVCGKEEVGFLGEVSLGAREEMGLKETVTVFEIDFEKLVNLKREIKSYEPFLKLPAVIRDLAILVPEKATYKEVIEKIKKTGGGLLKKIELFDVYQGKSIPKQKKNFAFRLFFQTKDKTLSSKEINKLQNKMIKALDDVPGWKVRK